MSAFFIYLSKVIVCSSLFAGCYWLFLRKERFYAWNRFFIMASVALSILIPVWIIPVGNASQLIPATNEIFSHFVINPNGSEMDELILSGPSPVSYQSIGLSVYFAVVFLLLGKKLIYFSRILRLRKRLERFQTPETDVYYTDEACAPFTFFRSIFWKKDISFDSEEGQYVYRHELAHVRLGHSRDKTFMQLVCCIFWINPFFLLFRHELELVHEFAADNESLGEDNANELSSLLLCTLYPNYYRDFISRFFQSPVKRRIFMITKNKTQKSSMNMLRKMSIIPVTMFALYAFSIQPADTITSKSSLSESVMQQDPWTPQNELEELIVVVGYGQNVTPRKDIQVIRDSERTIAPGAISYTEVEQKPVFQEGKDSYFRFMTNHIKYPVIAQENGIVGKIVVSYVIDTNGNVTDVKSPVKIDGLSMEGERLIKLMPAWKPGSHKGKNVAVQCYAIMEFRLQSK